VDEIIIKLCSLYTIVLLSEKELYCNINYFLSDILFVKFSWTLVQ